MLDPPLIINLAPTGAVADKRKNSLVPITVEDIIADVADCAPLGISIAHLHVRNEDGTPSCDTRLFARLFEGLRNHPQCSQLILCATTSGRHSQTLEQRAAVLDLLPDLRPDMASLTLGSLNFPSGPSVNSPDSIRGLVDRMNDAGVKPELEAFDAGMIEFAKVLIKEGRLKSPCYFNLLLGNIGGLQATPQHLGFALSIMPDNSIVSVAGIGKYQARANALGVVCCDGVRVGLEDNLWLNADARTPASNELLTRRIVDLCQSTGRSLAAPSWVRTILHLRQSDIGGIN